MIANVSPTSRSFLRPNGMRVVKPNQALSKLVMQRQAVGDTVGAFCRRRHALHHKSNLIKTLRIDKETYAVESQEMVQAMIMPLSHALILSYGDNSAMAESAPGSRKE